MPLPPHVVWAEMAQLERQAERMADADSVTIIDGPRANAGTKLEVRTHLGPFRAKDIIEVTAWEPPAPMAVVHQEAVSGTGEFLLTETPRGTRFTWTEHLRFPWFLGGRAGFWLARPLLRRVWARSLQQLRRRLSTP